jgi:hypothetical protein
MRKWVLIFLLLVNVIVFFGFAMRGQDAYIRSDEEVVQAFELRLVSEVAQDSLIKIADQKKQDDIQPWFVEGACILYEGISDQKIADKIAGFMSEQGLSPIILVQTVATEKYQLILAVPEEIETRLALESQLQEKDFLLTVANTNAKEFYQFGNYASAEEGDKARQGLLSVSLALQVQAVVGAKKTFSIQLADDIDRNLINKINDVLKLSDETLKIEKKVCKGVASTKPHQ